jgi:hypothetical protein
MANSIALNASSAVVRHTPPIPSRCTGALRFADFYNMYRCGRTVIDPWGSQSDIHTFIGMHEMSSVAMLRGAVMKLLSTSQPSLATLSFIP